MDQKGRQDILEAFLFFARCCIIGSLVQSLEWQPIGLVKVRLFMGVIKGSQKQVANHVGSVHHMVLGNTTRFAPGGIPDSQSFVNDLYVRGPVVRLIVDGNGKVEHVDFVQEIPREPLDNQSCIVGR